MLSYIENGDITLIASTTENPYFYVYNAILSRSTVFEFKTLKADDIKEVILRAVRLLSDEKAIKIKEKLNAMDFKRKLLNLPNFMPQR